MKTPLNIKISLLFFIVSFTLALATDVYSGSCSGFILCPLLSPGDFAENITIRGISSSALRLEDIIEIGDHVVLEVSRIGKECHSPCSIFYQTGDCVMPREGFFARVVNGGEVYPGSAIKITSKIDRQLHLIGVKGD